MFSSPSWLTSLECSPTMIQSSNDSSFMLHLLYCLRFIFLSPCPQRILITCLDFVFIFTLFVLAINSLFSRFFMTPNSSSFIKEPLLEIENLNFRFTLWFYLTFGAASSLAISYTILCVLGLSFHSQWEYLESMFRLAHTIAFIAIVVLISHVKRFKVVVHPFALRLYLKANFIIATLFVISGATRLVSRGSHFDAEIATDDAFSLSTFPLSAFLFIVAIRGSSGINLIKEPEFDTNNEGYSNASWYSKAVWLWMNPLLSKGYKTPLKIHDVPSLPLKYNAQRMADLFENNWPHPIENSTSPLRTTLLRCFWKNVVLTGVLSVVKLAVTYVGPLLIQRFVNYTSGERISPYEGYYLITTLVLAKIVEVLSSHHFNFESKKLGMLIRSSLIATLYKKGVNLSCSSRQSHGVGQIVNYMAVDCQRLADMMVNLHPIWMMPLQVGVAVVLLYGYMGVAVLSTIIMVILVMIFTMWITSRNNKFMFSMMKYQDLRMKAINEMISNMGVIKFQAWEDHFSKKIESFRESEYKWLKKFTFSVSWNMVVLSSVTSVIAALVFSVAIWLGKSLDAGKVFTAMTLLRILQDPIRNFPQALVTISQAMISMKRLDGYLTSEELDGDGVEREDRCGDGGVAVQVIKGGFSWGGGEEEEVLKDVNMEIKKGQLAAIVGSVGSGKSSLLASLLGELQKVSGKVRVCGSSGYVAQTSWIQNASIQDNIVFGSSMNKERYEEVMRVCGLEKDLEMMEDGDKTEIGERGINLSGGQKQRIQLARAVYQDSDIYLLDDVFSALDAHTGSLIFKECVRGALKDKTILLVTHQVDFLRSADVILVMRDGKIVQSGKYEELLKIGMDFGALVAAYETSMELVDIINTNNHITPLKSPHSVSSGANSDGPKNLNKLIEDEERETGGVNIQVYKQYSTEVYGWFGVVAVIFMSIMSQSSGMASDYWLAYQTSAFNGSLFIGVYWIIGLVSFFVILVRTFVVSIMGLKTAQSLFSQLLNSMIHAPMSFFDTTPTGRILTRASNDQSNVDFLIPLFLSITITMYFGVVGILFVTCQSAWPTVFLIIPLAWLNFWYRGYYLATSRELTRLDSITKAPIIQHFSETLSGVMTVRSFSKQQSFVLENIKRIDANLRMDLYNNGSNEWLGFRLELIGTIVLSLATIFLIMFPSTFISSANVGLYLSYGLSLNGMLFWSVYIGCIVENKMVSVERIKHFISISSEPPWKISDSLPSPHWPTHGHIQINDLQVRYRANTPLVIKGISLKINGGEKIGVVGRTGSGKSTLIQAFFRLVEPCGGTIIIDGVDICKLGLHDLRSRFSIIPQDPILFQGTVRTNIDPLHLYSDDEIWKSLERCQLKDVVATKPEKLNAPVVESGDNWSVGQRQLLCLGRVLLKRSRILFMDEATASVDSQTDSVIQKIIREDFSECSIITIAHRIPTVIDCDMVLVIDDGWAKEYEKPAKLLKRPSLFGILVKEYASRSSNL